MCKSYLLKVIFAMVKIFHILPGKANPNTMNGVNKVVDAVATEQTRMGYDVTVVGVAGNTKKRHQPCYNYKLYKRAGLFQYPKGLLEFLLSQSDENSYFHFHSVFTPWFLRLIRGLKKNNRAHIFLTPHGQYVDAAMNLSLKKRLFFSLFDKKILNEVEATHIIGCVSENNEYVVENSKRVVCIPNGFGNQVFVSSKDKPQLIIGYLGRLERKQKGLDILIKGFAIYRNQGGKALLWLAGSGPDETVLKNMVSDEGLLSSVEFKGALFDKQKWNFINTCAALITPSRWDVIPTACLEAAAASRPLLVTEATNLGNYIRKYNAGLIIDELSPEAIAEQLYLFESLFCDEHKYTNMSDGAKKMIDCELNWNNIANRICQDLYKNEKC